MKLYLGNKHIGAIAIKPCSACYVLRNLKYIVPPTTLRTIYYAYVHTILSYGIIFWGNSTNVNPYPTAFPYGNGMVLHFYQQQESSMTKTVHKVINKGLKTYV